MRSKTLKFKEGFRIAFANRRGQAAEMVIPPGDAEGDAENRHRGADQWLFVLSGRGRATIEGKRVTLGPGTLLLIERGERHEVRNIGRTNLRTLNFYTPPAYKQNEVRLPAGKP